MHAEVIRRKGSYDNVKFVFGLKNIGEDVYHGDTPLEPFDVIVYSEDRTFLSYVNSNLLPVHLSLSFKLKPGQSYNASMHPRRSPETVLWDLKLDFPKSELKDWKKWFVEVRDHKQTLYFYLKPGKYLLKGVWLLEGWAPGGWDRGAEVITSPLTMEIKQRYVLHWPS